MPTGAQDGDGPPTDAEGSCKLEAPLLGTVQRRCTEAPSLVAHAAADAIREALLAETAVHAVALLGAESLVSSEAAPAAGAGVEVDASEEAAVMLGYLDYMEDEFFADDEEDEAWDEDDEDDDEGDGIISADFFAKMAQLRAKEEEMRSSGPGAGNEI